MMLMMLMMLMMMLLSIMLILNSKLLMVQCSPATCSSIIQLYCDPSLKIDPIIISYLLGNDLFPIYLALTLTWISALTSDHSSEAMSYLDAGALSFLKIRL